MTKLDEMALLFKEAYKLGYKAAYAEMSAMVDVVTKANEVMKDDIRRSGEDDRS